MKDLRDRLYLTTIAPDAAETARDWHLGLEIAEFCTASNMDADFPAWDKIVREKLSVAGGRCAFHAPFNELCPAAIDPLVLDVTKKRYRAAMRLARSYGARRMVVHSGFIPFVYFPEYFIERSVEFWTEFLAEAPADFALLIENVLESAPDMLIEIARRVNDKRLRLCLDTGHAMMMKKGISLEEWLEQVLPYLGHAHLHNNDGASDSHGALEEGLIDMEYVVRTIAERSDATMTIETRESRRSVEWLHARGFLQG
jgi:sugar phosphate isomerase/epimerase